MRRIATSQDTAVSQPSHREGFHLSQREVWTSALGMLDCHGANALEMACCQAEAMIDRGDVAGAELWSRILGAIEELQRPEPRQGESIH